MEGHFLDVIKCLINKSSEKNNNRGSASEYVHEIPVRGGLVNDVKTLKLISSKFKSAFLNSNSIFDPLVKNMSTVKLIFSLFTRLDD